MGTVAYEILRTDCGRETKVEATNIERIKFLLMVGFKRITIPNIGEG